MLVIFICIGISCCLETKKRARMLVTSKTVFNSIFERRNVTQVSRLIEILHTLAFIRSAVDFNAKRVCYNNYKKNTHTQLFNVRNSKYLFTKLLHSRNRSFSYVKRERCNCLVEIVSESSSL